MNFVQDKQRRTKIKLLFARFSSNGKTIPNNRVRKFFEELGITSQLFFHDFYYYYPDIENGADLKYEDCLAFIDYILTPKTSNREIVNMFKLFDKNGIGHITTTELLSYLRKQLPTWEYEKYAQIISSYGSSINYIDMFQKNKENH